MLKNVRAQSCKVIAISAQKGGTGKSTTCANLAVGLAKAGKKVCTIDLDSQSNLTMSFGFNPDTLNITITDIFNGIMDKTFDYQKEDYMLHAEGIDLVPADITFATIEKTIVGVDSRENILKKFIAKIKDDYDYILVDCQPSLNTITKNALTAADSVLIPVQAHFLSAKGLEMLIKTIFMVQEDLNPNLSISGILITMIDGRASFPKELIEIINNTYGSNITIYDTKIPMSIKATEAQANGKSLFAYDPKCKLAESYLDFTEEFLRLEEKKFET